MGAEEVTVVCQGVLEKKVDHRMLPIGPTWKRKYCVLSSEALRIYRNKAKLTNNCIPLRTVPLCHLKSVSRSYEDSDDTTNYFNLETEQGEKLFFRHKDDTGWVAQIQIQLIHYKNRQDILRYKQLNNSMAVAESAIQKYRASNPNNNDVSQCNSSNRLYGCSIRGCRTVVLPNQRNNGMGIGITVIPLCDERIVVNRVLEGGAAMRLGVLQPRDQIVSANGLRVTSVEMLSEIVRNSPETVTLVVKPRLSKPSPIAEDPKALLEKEDLSPEYINTIPTNSTAQTCDKGREKPHCRTHGSPKHFKFT